MNTAIVTTDTLPDQAPQSPDRGEQSLAQIAEKIISHLARADSNAISAMQHAINAGKLLTVAKTRVGHGNFERWVDDNCNIAVRTAQAYMRLSKRVGDLPAYEAQRVAHLPMREAIKAVATPNIVDREQGADHNGLNARKNTRLSTNLCNVGPLT